MGNTTAESWIAQGLTHGFYLEPPWRDLTLATADRFLARLGLLQGESTLAPPAEGPKLEKTP